MTDMTQNNIDTTAVAVDDTTTTTTPVMDSSISSLNLSAILPRPQMMRAIEQWIYEDMPTFDIGAMVVAGSSASSSSQQQPNSTGTAYLYMKSPGIFAGKPFVDMVFSILGCTVEWDTTMAIEGTYIDPTPTKKIRLATVTGPVAQILQGERTALNILSRCSGVATVTNAAVRVARSHGWNGHVAGTRKTTPGTFRLIEKYGLLVGGGATHRMDLSQMIMLKDNHIMAANGSITQAVQCARIAAGFSSKIEVECQSLDEALEAAAAGADIVMLDNYNNRIPQLHADAQHIKTKFPQVLIEASGGITIETMTQYFSPHIDIISQGQFTQGYSCIDYSLKIVV